MVGVDVYFNIGNIRFVQKKQVWVQAHTYKLSTELITYHSVYEVEVSLVFGVLGIYTH